jgi:ABC-2 type transport system ATP-binding protein
MHLIETRQLVRKFGDFVAVAGVDFHVDQGEVFGFLGPNGAGKSTTINMLCTMLRPSSGTASINGYDVSRQPRGVRQSIGIIFQDSSLDDRLTGRENMRFHAMLYDVPYKTYSKRAAELLAMVDLADKADDIVRTYSGGMKRRLEIARGLLHHPKVLFLDEPTVGLDPQTRRHIWDYLLKLRQQEGVTMFMTTHYMDEAEHCNRIALMHSGKLVALDTPSGLKQGTIDGEVLEIEGTPQDEARALVAALPGVLEVAPHGARLHAIVDDAALRSNAALDVLQAGGIADARVERIDPSLEDVFVALLGRGAAGN